MIEKWSIVKNPLTVIAVFCSIVEVGSLSVLPFLGADNQTTYMWFLILYSSALVGLFFVTLNFNNKVLYSPSDFRDDKSFLDCFRPATPEELLEKRKQESSELESDEATSLLMDTRSSPRSETDHSLTSSENELLRSIAVESLVVHKLSLELGVPIEQNMTYRARGGQNYTFDGYAVREGREYIVEVKYLRGKSDANRIDCLIGRERARLRNLGQGFSLIIAIVVDEAPELVEEMAPRLLESSRREFQNIQIRVYQTSQLIGGLSQD